MPAAPTIHTAEVLPPRAVLFLGIVAVHAVLVYFLGNHLIRGVAKLIDPQPIELIPIPETVIEPQPEDAVDPVLRKPIYVPPTDVPVPPTEAPPDTLLTTPIAPDPAPLPGPAIVAEPPPIRLVGRNIIPNAESYYPAQYRRQGIEGSAEVKACVTPEGVLSSTPTVERTSGRAPFDQAAVRLIEDGRFARAMRGDVPVPNCYRFRVSFTMQ